MTAASAPTGGAIIWAASIRIWSSDEAAVALGNEGWQAVSRQRAGADTLDFPRGATNKHTIPSRFPEMLDHAGSTILEKSIKSPPQSRKSRRLPSTLMGDSVGDPGVEDLKLVDTTVPASVVSAASVGAAELLTTCAVVALPVVPVALLVPMQPGVPALQGV